MSVYVSSGSFIDKTPSQMAEELRAFPTVGLELSSGFSHRPGMLEEIRGLKSHGVPLLVHNYFPPPEVSFVLNLAARDAAIRNRSVDFCRAALALTAELGAPFYSVHSGFAMDLKPSDLGDHAAQSRLSTDRLANREEALEIFTESLRTLCIVAKSHGVKLLIENNVVSATHKNRGMEKSLLMNHPGEIREFFKTFSDSTLGLLLDTGHANVTACTLGLDPHSYFEELNDYITGLHLSDNDGQADSNGCISRDSWFMPHLSRFADKPMVIEVYRLSPEKRASQIRDLQTFLSA